MSTQPLPYTSLAPRDIPGQFQSYVLLKGAHRPKSTSDPSAAAPTAERQQWTHRIFNLTTRLA